MTNDENKIPTPENWHWAITPEDVAKLKNNDRETVNKVYFDNYITLQNVAYKFAYKHHHKDMAMDCLHQFYIDLPKYDYTNAKTFYCGLVRSGYITICPGRCLSLEASISKNKHGEDFGTLADLIPVDGFAEMTRRERERNVLLIISEQTKLTDIQKDALTAAAFGCRVYRGLFNYEIARITS